MAGIVHSIERQSQQFMQISAQRCLQISAKPQQRLSAARSIPAL
jgi:hypothetical protein